MEKNGHAQSLPKIDGKWDESLTASMPDGSKQLIWKVNPPAADPTRWDLPHYLDLAIASLVLWCADPSMTDTPVLI